MSAADFASAPMRGLLLLGTMMANTTTHSPPPTNATPHHNGTSSGDGDDPKDGYCTGTDMWFVLYVVLGFVTWLVNFAVARLAKRGPTAGQVSYGRPWIVVHLFLSILVWSTLPNAFGFALFHFAIPHSSGSFFEDAARFSCVNVYGSVPFIGLFFAIQGVLIVAVTRPQPYNEAVAQLLIPANHIQELVDNQSSALRARFHAPTILVYGSASKGNVYIEVLKRALGQFDASPELRELAGPPRVILADVGKMRSFVACNADAMGLPPGAVEVVDVGPVHVPVEEYHAPPSSAAALQGMQGLSSGASETSMAATGAEGPSSLYGSNAATSATSRAAMQWRNTAAEPETPPLAIPLATAYVDEVFVAPFIRKMPPIGDFITDGETVRHHMQLAAAEIRRVLRPGGRVRVVDGLLEVLAAEADFMAAGFTVIQPTHSLHRKIGSVIVMQKPQYCCILESVPESAGAAESVERHDADIAAGLQVRHSMVMRGVPSNAFRADPGEGADTEQLLLAPGSPKRADERAVFIVSSHHGKAKNTNGPTVYQAGAGRGYQVLLACQFSVFFVLLLLAACVAHPLDQPTAVPLGTRVGSLLFSIAYYYPMMAYFSRMVAASKAATVSLAAMVAGTMQNEMVTTAVSLALSCLLYLPQLGLQWGLASTSLSLNTRAYIGIAVSIGLSLVLFKRGQKVQIVNGLKAIDVSEERYKGLLASG